MPRIFLMNRGFFLLTLLLSLLSGFAVADVAGKWKTSEGDLTLQTSGNQVRGSYTNDNGELIGKMSGNVLEGFWIESNANERCMTPLNGRYFWGRIRWVFDANKFAGAWSYCDKPVQSGANSWSGERSGSGPVYAGNASLRLDKMYFAPGETIVVHFAAPSNWPENAWIGIIPASIPHGSEAVNDQHDITYQYLGKRTAGSLTFKAPSTPGNWDFRLHDTDNNGKEFASANFSVGDADSGGRDYGGQSSAASKSMVLFDNGNIAGVGNGPNQPTTFRLTQPHVISLIQNYHWNSARGATPGSIGLRDAIGNHYGPWQSDGSPGQGGVPNAYWTVRPDITLLEGEYSVFDSHPASWSRNAGSQQRGFTRVEGYPAAADAIADGGRMYTSDPRPDLAVPARGKKDSDFRDEPDEWKKEMKQFKNLFKD